jgi:hypothetical protein
MGAERDMLNEQYAETTFSFSPMAPPPPERRRSARQITILRVGTLITSEGRELCLVRNISGGGLMAHVYCQHQEGERITVELKVDHRISGHILWVRDSNIGIEFDEMIDVEEMLTNQAMQEQGWRHRMPRVEVDRLATLRVGAHLYGVNTCDISQGGVKIESDEPVEAGTEVMLSLEKFRPVAGVVRWCDGGFCGISFNQPIPFQELMAWLRPKG